MLTVHAERADHALSRIFWGTLVCVFDLWFAIHSNGNGLRFDVINDVIGTLLIVSGLNLLRPLVADDDYERCLNFAFWVALAAVGGAVGGHFVLPWPKPIVFLSSLFATLCLVAIYFFCTAMRIFCRSTALYDVEQDWRWSQTLFLVLQLIPAVILDVLHLVALVSGSPIELGPLRIVLLIASVASLVFLLRSIWWTKLELKTFPAAKPLA
jgi:hypothetical protein